MNKKLKRAMQSLESWAPLRESIQNGGTKLTFAQSFSGCEGVEAIEAKSFAARAPYGWLWYREDTGRVLAIAQCFVPSYLRRCGIMTAMFKELLRRFPETRQVVTGRATEFSLPWLLKMGFAFNDDFDRWELNIEPPQKEAKASKKKRRK